MIKKKSSQSISTSGGGLSGSDSADSLKKMSGSQSSATGSTASPGNAIPSHHKGFDSAACRFVPDVREEYQILGCVMPSTHRGQEVRFGKRLRDGITYVVKIREKNVSFKDPNDILQWRTCMEMLLQRQQYFGEVREYWSM